MTAALIAAEHLSPAMLTIAFSVLLVLSLVAAEEVELRREAVMARRPDGG